MPRLLKTRPLKRRRRSCRLPRIPSLCCRQNQCLTAFVRRLILTMRSSWVFHFCFSPSILTGSSRGGVISIRGTISGYRSTFHDSITSHRVMPESDSHGSCLHACSFCCSIRYG